VRGDLDRLCAEPARTRPRARHGGGLSVNSRKRMPKRSTSATRLSTPCSRPSA
jgi:hypothetical protein